MAPPSSLTSSSDGPQHAIAAETAAIEIWRVDLDAAGPAVRQVWRSLCQRLDREAGAQSHAGSGDTATRPTSSSEPRKAAADAALRCLLAGRVGVVTARRAFSRGPKGKPSISGARVEFSLSHSEATALIAIGNDSPLGIDVELLRPVRVSPHRRAQIEAAAEQSTGGRPLPAAGADGRFLAAWVRLEAAAKATGEGIGALLTRLLPDRQGADSQNTGLGAVEIHDLALSGAPAAVAALAVCGNAAICDPKLFPTHCSDIEQLMDARFSIWGAAAGGAVSGKSMAPAQMAMLATYSGPSELAPRRPRATPPRA